ncbi:MAG: hypothetical protein K8L91_29490 [Anaerolineae bacterium]|nr:hypothetical protein [Anaerolineae bacterium]
MKKSWAEYTYPYSPSKDLSKRGSIVPESYYFSEGRLIFNGDSADFVSCQFEIGYMEDSSAWTIVYVPAIEENTNILRELDSRIVYAEKELIGVEKIHSGTINVSNLRFAEMHGSTAFGGAAKVVFSVGRYQITISNQETDDGTRNRAYFYLTGLPLSSNYARDQTALLFDMIKTSKTENDAALDAVIRYTFDNRNTVFDEVRSEALEEAKKAKTKVLSDTFSKEVPIRVSSQNITVGLQWHNNAEDITYPSQPASVLTNSFKLIGLSKGVAQINQGKSEMIST